MSTTTLLLITETVIQVKKDLGAATYSNDQFHAR